VTKGWTILAGAAALMAAGAAQASSVSTGGFASAAGCTLSELFAGGSIGVGDVTFSNFALVASFADGVPNVDPSAAFLTGVAALGSAGFGIGFTPAPALDVVDAAIEYAFSFDAAISGSAREMVGLSLSTAGVTRSGDASFSAAADEGAIDGIGLAQIIADTLAGVDLSDDASFPAAASASFQVEFDLTVFEAGASISLSSLDFSVALDGVPPTGVVPLPATVPMLLGGFAMLGMLRRARRTAAWPAVSSLPAAPSRSACA
jgi:hypothetical protein